jgi:hypothetical protein
MSKIPPFIRDPSVFPPNVIDAMPAIITKIAAETPWPPTLKAGEVVVLKKRVA